MQDAARSQLICMLNDPKALVDLLLHLEKNFSTLLLEMIHVSSVRSVADGKAFSSRN